MNCRAVDAPPCPGQPCNRYASWLGNSVRGSLAHCVSFRLSLGVSRCLRFEAIGIGSHRGLRFCKEACLAASTGLKTWWKPCTEWKLMVVNFFVKGIHGNSTRKNRPLEKVGCVGLWSNCFCFWSVHNQLIKYRLIH
jgi:hypothetical protein